MVYADHYGISDNLSGSARIGILAIYLDQYFSNKTKICDIHPSRNTGILPIITIIPQSAWGIMINGLSLKRTRITVWREKSYDKLPNTVKFWKIKVLFYLNASIHAIIVLNEIIYEDFSKIHRKLPVLQ